MVTVPSNYQPYVKQASSGTGLPYQVVAEQANAESGFNANAVSSAGAEGWLQFLPSTYNAYAPRAGVPQNTEFNVADETKVYIAYMNELLKEEGGSIFKALEAYNAGPGNLNAGAGYARGILQAAGVSETAQAGGGTNVSTASINIPGIPGIPGVNNIIGAVFGGVLKAFGVPSFKDMFQRLGLILFGAALVYMGIRILSEGHNSGNKNGGGGAAPAGGNSNSQRSREPKPQKEAKGPSTKALSSTSAESSASVESLDVGPTLEAAEVA